MAFEAINLVVDGDGIAVLELNRPDRLNAFNLPMLAEWREALAQIAADERVRVVVLTGAGRAFCAGADTTDMDVMLTARNTQRKDYLWKLIQKIPLAMERLEVPVIAAVNGTARGAGLDMALMCDIRLCAASSTFAESYINMGVISGDGGTWFLPRVVGVSRALELLWTGRVVDAAEAERIGIVTRVVPRCRYPRRGHEARAKHRQAATASDHADEARGVSRLDGRHAGSASGHGFVAHGHRV